MKHQLLSGQHIRGMPTPDEVLTRVFESHYDRLVKVCVLLSGVDEGEDIAQEAFLRAAKTLGEVEEAARFSYLRATAINLWKNQVRRRSILRRMRPDPTESEGGIGEVDERDSMWRRIAALPPRQRAVLVLRYYEDLTERETATLLNCSIGTVKSQGSRALTKLRKDFGDEKD